MDAYTLYVIIGVLASVLSTIAAVAAGRSLHATYQAERAWVKGLEHIQGAQGTLLDLHRRQLLAMDDTLSATPDEIDRAILSLVRQLEQRQEISKRERRHLEAALHQPSPQGRFNYREKLLEEALSGKVMFA